VVSYLRRRTTVTWNSDELIVEFSPDRVELRVRVDQDGPIYRSFSLQLVAIVDGTRYPVVRCDCSHGSGPHRDFLNWDGSTQRKAAMWEGMTYRDAFDHAYDDFSTNWQRYVEDFLRRRP